MQPALFAENSGQSYDAQTLEPYQALLAIFNRLLINSWKIR